MPKMNGTGPTGKGSLTGRGMGTCKNGAQEYPCPCRRGRGMGFGRFFRSPQTSIQSLEEEEKMLTARLESVKSEKESLGGQK